MNWLLRFWRVTIWGAQPSTRLSEEIYLSEGSQGPLRGSLWGFCGVTAGLCGTLPGSTGFSEGSAPIFVTLGNCWTGKRLPHAGFVTKLADFPAPYLSSFLSPAVGACPSLWPDQPLLPISDTDPACWIFFGSASFLLFYFGHPEYHPGRNDYKIIPLNHNFCNNLWSLSLAKWRVFITITTFIASKMIFEMIFL